MTKIKSTVVLINMVYSYSGKADRPPVGLIYLGSALQKANFGVQIFHVTSWKEVIQTFKTIEKIPNLLFIGFSVFMGPSSIISLKMSEILKNRLGIPIVWGGKYPSSIPEQVLKESCIDAVCIGEGERTIVDLARTFETGEVLLKVKGLVYRDADSNVIHTKPQELIEDLDILDYDLSLINDWLPYIKNINGKRTIIDCFESQRGCLFRCRFCFHSREQNRRVRSHSVDWVIDKVKKLREKCGVEMISFCDDEFWLKRERSFRLMEELRKMGVSFYKLRMRFSSLKDEDMISRLINLGVYTMNFGLESGTDRILEVMDKKLTTAEVLQKIKLLTKYPAIHASAPIIIGSPTETKEEVMESMRFALKLTHINPNFNFGVNFYKPLPGTAFFKMVVELGFIPPNNLMEWATIEHRLVHRIADKWLPWFNEKEKRNYEHVHNYLKFFYLCN